MIVGVGVDVPPAKVRSQVRCFRGGVLQVELLGIGKAVALTCSDGYIYALSSSINAGTWPYTVAWVGWHHG